MSSLEQVGGRVVMPIKQVIVIRKDLNMRKGKMVAQGAHAAMMFLLKGAEWEDLREVYGPDWGGYQMRTRALTDAEAHWAKTLFTKVVVSVDSEEELKDLITKGEAADLIVHSVMDAGLTEFHGVPTLTCAAFGPDEAEKIDAITGGCKLL